MICRSLIVQTGLLQTPEDPAQRTGKDAQVIAKSRKSDVDNHGGVKEATHDDLSGA
jgi:hypothetical protein